MPSNSPTQLSHTWQQSGGLPAVIEVVSFCRACACGTNSTLTSKSFCDWLKRWTSDSTRALRFGSGTLNWKRTGAAPQARRPPPPGEARRREGARGGHRLQELSAREDAALVHVHLLLEISFDPARNV